MTALTLPLRTDAPRYSIRVDLDAARYVFDFEWNDRAGAWFFDLSDAAGVRLLSSVRVSLGCALLERFADPALPPGVLFAVDTTGADIEPARADLGDRVQLVYYPLADIPADLVR